jgi:hypothetical protein
MKSFQKKSESVTDGDVRGADAALLTGISDYIAATFTAGHIKQRGTTLLIVTPFAGNATLFGKPIKTVTINFTNFSSSAKPVTKSLNVKHARSSTSARGSKRKSLKN